MPKLDRRHFLTFMGALVPSIFLTKAEAFSGFSLKKAANSALGAYVTKSSAIKVGQSRAYKGKDSSGRTVEVILSRSKKSLIALDGTCTHQGCTVELKKAALVCPCHGSVFQASTGAVVLGPNGSPKNTISPLSKYRVTEKAGKIYIK
ncbi:MAG: Rieske (2Fe-2S) protein [Candidatus Nanopelagicaceae bacterium]|nr:Rieske (2Fe-2S) protein [Candidatus Nanopelagicaceae bacterium]